MRSLATLGAAAALGASTALGAIPPAYQAHLPQARELDGIPFITGGKTPEEADAVKRAAQEWPLEVVFEEQDRGTDRKLERMPITITDASGKVVFDGLSEGPILLARLPRGHYIVTTRWDAWTFSRPVTIGEERQRVVFDWKRPAPETAG